jgi:hypothetical protein
MMTDEMETLTGPCDGIAHEIGGAPRIATIAEGVATKITAVGDKILGIAMVEEETNLLTLGGRVRRKKRTRRIPQRGVLPISHAK